MKDCNQCGKCCIKYGGEDLSVTKEEVDLWEMFEPNIFKFVKDYKTWFDPESGVRLKQCPFLEVVPKETPLTANKYTCSIYFNRPEDCRLYPSLIPEMIRDECEMIEAVDIANPKQAQIKLDVLMIDSHS
ncbi:YkgJ family cysteine cluster protein [Pseudocolwellia agarivorans]|uniref:YkgJ family cysteine cluster protein n=1 Tax=Pseudocolwellia agarivorans TaxID=1911682 RepID=UPI000987A13F|nr:YkgJ family cysteine cluster protein [Pseudocolwellia agarivorans]